MGWSDWMDWMGWSDWMDWMNRSVWMDWSVTKRIRRKMPALDFYANIVKREIGELLWNIF